MNKDMTNRELIEKLSKFPKNAKVVIPIPCCEEIDKLKDIDLVVFNIEGNRIGLIWTSRK
jgi:hypothetical protein